ncbi:MAG: tetratricopeptide (TPR) repeat protein [Limisphaerales bacterium]|jgi:tetratricopeptide (TPR) repeat protein
MRALIFVLYILLLAPAQLLGQTRRMTDPLTGKQFVSNNSFNSAFPLLQQAHNQVQLTNWEEALFTLDAAVTVDPYSAEALLVRAKVKRALGMFSEARKDLGFALRLNPFVADLYGYSGQFGLMRVLASYPMESMSDLKQRQKLQYYYYDIDRKLESELINKNEAQTLENIIVLIERGKTETANFVLDSVLEANPYSAIALDLKGNLLLQDSLLEEAEKVFLGATKILPDFAISWYNLGRVYMLRGDKEMAHSYFSKAIELRPNLTKAYFERAAILKSMGENAQAIQDYDQVIRDNGSKYAQAFLNRGLTKKMEGDFNGAFRDLDMIIEEFTDNAELLKNRANLHLLFGSVAQGVADYTKAINMKPDYAEAYFNRGLAHFIMYDSVSGCHDLAKSEGLGYKRSAEYIQYFCALR